MGVIKRAGGQVDVDRIKSLLEAVESGRASVSEALEQLRSLPYEDLGYAKPDHHRAIRTGHPEVVFCQGKTTNQVVEIMRNLRGQCSCVMGTRATREVFDAVQAEVPDCVYYESARIIIAGEPKRDPSEVAKDKKFVLLLCAGTADLPVAEEAAITASTLGSRVERAYDVGVAGIHRLLDQRERLFEANVLVAVAGMEGALASVVGGLVSRPVIAVPTSVGYGASFGGIAPLLTMLNSCATGVSVVNIDNGFGAGYLAHLINQPTASEGVRE